MVYNGTTYRVTSIGSYAFSGCTGLTEVAIPNSVTSIGSEAFIGCTGLKKVIVPDIAAWCRISFGSYYANPLYYAHRLYSDENTEITKLTIPNSVTSIDEYTFAGCSGLTEVTIPNSVTSIDFDAFGGCTGLKKVIVPDIAAWCRISFGSYYANPLYYAHRLYSDENTEITKLTIPNSVVFIGSYAFDGCTGLTEVTIPNSVTSIGIYAFDGCTGLTEVTIPDSVAFIGSYAFAGCTGLTEVTIADGTETLRSFDMLFHNCPIERLYLGRNISYSEYPLFKSNTSLKTLTIGNSVTEIGADVFRGCTGLTEVTIADGTATLSFSTSSSSSALFNDCPIETLYMGRNINFSSSNSPFKNNTSLKTLTIGNNVTSIGRSTFAGCSGLTKVAIPNNVTSINTSTFSGCSGLTELSIGSGVTSIGALAFKGCTSLASITSLNTTPPEIKTSTFDTETEKKAVLHVPDGCKSIYEQTQYWENFFDIQTDAVDGIERVRADMEQGSEQGGQAVIYTLNGVKLSTTDPSTLPKGIYIVNGKKIAVK